MSIPSTGFCILLKRLRQEKRTGKIFSRTVGEYSCYWNGSKVQSLTGQIVERGGPGDNTTSVGNAQDLRISEGTYRLAIQQGEKYWTNGYSLSQSHTALPRPALLLKDTGQRSAILIHPGMDYVWSVGCLNPASGLTNASSSVNYVDSRSRVVALIDFLKANTAAFPASHGKAIPGAVMVIEGEP